MKPKSMAEISILVIDAQPAARDHLQRVLQHSCALLEFAVDIEEARALSQRCHFDMLIADPAPAAGDDFGWLAQVRARNATMDIILTTACEDLDLAIAALREGVNDLVRKPFHGEEIRQAVHRCLQRRRNGAQRYPLRSEVPALPDTPHIIGSTPHMRRLCELIGRVAPTNSNILIEGETGTGKELVARALHDLSMRAGPLVPVNCGSITPELLESELFGHSKGAFTGAHNAREGLCQYAAGGTLFLDEVGEMSLAMQVKLLRMLEEHVIRPIGVDREQPVDCRVVAATNRNLEAFVSSGRFREDLYFRLNVLKIEVPPLREHPDDIPPLVEHFMHRLAAELNVPAIRLNEVQLGRLQAYHWPGNVRELRNIIERALLLGELPANCFTEPVAAAPPAQFALQPGWTLSDVERHYLMKTLNLVNGNKSEAARRLGISRKTIERKLSEWRRPA